MLFYFSEYTQLSLVLFTLLYLHPGLLLPIGIFFIADTLGTILDGKLHWASQLSSLLLVAILVYWASGISGIVRRLLHAL